MSLIGHALEDLAGPAIVLDEGLRVVLATPKAEELVGTDVPVGVVVTKVLCGDAMHRPIAEALAAGRAVTGVVHRVGGGGEIALVVRATPITRGARVEGWVLLLGRDPTHDVGDDATTLFHGMWTRDPGLKRVFHVIERAARRDVRVLIRGETGTGKELVARAIHDLSPRSRGPFAAINCAALPPALLESELFGHVRGSFTGAVRDAPGIFRSADRGTLLLDEVAEMPLDLQAKLLRVLETRTVIPVGGHDPIPIDVRIVAATHQPLRAAVERGAFRADLMYRLRVIPIFIPPLRARAGDVALLAEKIVAELSAQGERVVTRISPGAMAALEKHPWPGNIRELRNALEYAFVIGEGPVLLPSDLPPEVLEATSGEDGAAAAMVNAPPPLSEESTDSGDPEERARIRRAIERAAGHRGRAAQILGVSRATLWRRMRALNIS